MLKKKHFEDNPNYQYHPRKPHEKKRRMARKIRAHHKDNEGLLSTSTGIPSTEIGAPGLEDFDFSFDFETTPAPLPEFDTTPAGNVVLTLGDENIDDATFEAMLREYNSTANVATAPGNAMASVLSTEPLGETEEDFHFLTSVLNFDAMAPVDAEVDAAYMKVFGTVLKLDEVWHSLNYQEQGEVWDDVNRYGWQAALVRYVIEKKAPSQLE